MAGNMLPLLGIAAAGAILVASSSKKKKSKPAKGEVVLTEQIWKEGTPGFGQMVNMQVVKCPDGTFFGQYTKDNLRYEASGIKMEWHKTEKKATKEDARKAILALIEKQAWDVDMPSDTAEDDAMPVAMEGTLQGYDYQIIEVVNDDGSVAGYVGAIRKANASEDWRSVAEGTTAETVRLLTLEKIDMLAASGDNTDQA